MAKFSSDSVKNLTAALDRLDNFIFLETCRLSPGNHRSLLFTGAKCWLEFCLGEDPGNFFQRIENFCEQGYAVAGYMEYELGYLLEPSLRPLIMGEKPGRVIARLGVFEKPLVFDHRSGGAEVPSEWFSVTGAEKSCYQESHCKIRSIKPNISENEFYADIDKIKKYISSGDSYQVNYTFKLEFAFSGCPAALYCQLRYNQSVSYAAWLRFCGTDIMSFSPELFFHAEKSKKRIRVRPMKGTARRGLTLEEDKKAAKNMCEDRKIISENIMIVDLLRNDLGRLLHDTGSGSVQGQSLFDVEVYESLLQLTSTVDGYFSAGAGQGISLSDTMYNLFPCGSVTGAPKIRTMEIIRELEGKPRGVYCGAIGWGNSEEMCFNVPIRTITLSGGKGCMGIGAGIVYDSDSEEEWRECLLKGRFLSNSVPGFELIETMLWRPEEGFVFLEEHLDRLMASATYFLFPADREGIRRQLVARCQVTGHRRQVSGDGGGQVTGDRRQGAENLSRGESLRVRLTLDRDGVVKITAEPFKISAYGGKVGKIAFSEHRVDPGDVFLYHKTTNRQLYNQERQVAEEQGLYEMLFINTKGEVTEGTISTLFVEKNNKLYTPSLSCGLLPGVYRRYMLESGRAEELVLSVDDVRSADNLFMANSVRGMVRVQVTGVLRRSD